MHSAAAGDARGGLARGGALEDVAHVGVLVLQRADEIRVAGARQMDLGDAARATGHGFIRSSQLA